MSKNNAEHQRTYRQRMRDQGFIEVIVWVPANGRERIKDLARELREQRARRAQQRGD